MTEGIHVWNCYLPAAFHVVPRIANQSDLVENGLIDAEVGSDVAGRVTTMEHLTLRFNVGVEPGLGLGSAGESGDGNGVVHGKAGVPRSDQGVDFSGWQRGLKSIRINSWTKLATLPPLLPLFLLFVVLLQFYVLNIEILLRTTDNIREDVDLCDTFKRSQTNFPANLLVLQATAPMTRKKTIDCILADPALWELEGWSGGSGCIRGKYETVQLCEKWEPCLDVLYRNYSTEKVGKILPKNFAKFTTHSWLYQMRLNPKSFQLDVSIYCCRVISVLPFCVCWILAAAQNLFFRCTKTRWRRFKALELLRRSISSRHYVMFSTLNTLRTRLTFFQAIKFIFCRQAVCETTIIGHCMTLERVH